MRLTRHTLRSFRLRVAATCLFDSAHRFLRRSLEQVEVRIPSLCWDLDKRRFQLAGRNLTWESRELAGARQAGYRSLVGRRVLDRDLQRPLPADMLALPRSSHALGFPGESGYIDASNAYMGMVVGMHKGLAAEVPQLSWCPWRRGWFWSARFSLSREVSLGEARRQSTRLPAYRQLVARDSRCEPFTSGGVCRT